MSSFNLTEIGDWVKKNQGDIAIVIGFVLVTLVAFGAGRLTAPPIVRNPVIIEELTSSSTNLYANVSQPLGEQVGEWAQNINNINNEKGLFVASKNSNKYHWSWCSWAKKIKPENQIWFKTEAQARAAGYSPCSCIQNQAPAGYRRQ